MRIGLVDLDTSHPGAWTPIERELGHDVVAVWDGGSVHPPGHADSFAAEHRIGSVCSDLAEMASLVDCAILHGCDWDKRIERSWPFVEEARALLLDKPIAGNVRDLEVLRGWAASGVRIAGGSAIRFCNEVTDWLAQPVEVRGTPDTVFCGCGVDEFNYGIHAYSLLCGILGSGARSVRHLSTGGQRRVEVTWEDGRSGIVVVGPSRAYLPFHATIVTGLVCTHFQVDASRVYRALLERTLPYLAGDAPEPPVPFDALIEPESIAIAARWSWTHDDERVHLDEMDRIDGGYDGAAFAREYRQARYPNGS